MQILNRILSRLEVAAPKSADAYQWFIYTGAKAIPISGRTPIVISKGTAFGVRPSSNGKLIRLVLPGQETRVFTIDMRTAKLLAKYCVPMKSNRKSAPPATIPKGSKAGSKKTWLTASHKKIFDKELNAGGQYSLMAEIGQIPGVKLKSPAEYWAWLCKQYAGSSILVTRTIALKQSRLSIKVLLRDAGTHWSSDVVEAPAHIKGINVRIYAEVKPEQIDWPTTISNRINYPGEQETTLRKGVMPKVLKVVDLRTNTEVPLS